MVGGIPPFESGTFARNDQFGSDGEVVGVEGTDIIDIGSGNKSIGTAMDKTVELLGAVLPAVAVAILVDKFPTAKIVIRFKAAAPGECLSLADDDVDSVCGVCDFAITGGGQGYGVVASGGENGRSGHASSGGRITAVKAPVISGRHGTLSGKGDSLVALAFSGTINGNAHRRYGGTGGGFNHPSAAELVAGCILNSRPATVEFNESSVGVAIVGTTSGNITTSGECNPKVFAAVQRNCIEHIEGVPCTGSYGIVIGVDDVG